MNICIYGASSTTLDEKYITAVEELGFTLAKRGNGLVFGGGRNGLMGAAARGFTKGNSSHILCVAPKFFNVDGILYEHCTQYIYPDTMRERKAILEESSDCFIAAPGGIGTLDELFEIVTLRSLGRHSKPVVLYNVFGFFNPMLDMLKIYEKEGFLKNFSELVFISDNPAEIALYLENHSQKAMNVEEFKNI